MPRNSDGSAATLADFIPAQDHYYLLSDGKRYARHGGDDATGLLVFTNLERAEQFYMTVGKHLPKFVPVKLSADKFLDEAAQVGAICIAEGLTVKVATICK